MPRLEPPSRRWAADKQSLSCADSQVRKGEPQFLLVTSDVQTYEGLGRLQVGLQPQRALPEGH